MAQFLARIRDFVNLNINLPTVTVIDIIEIVLIAVFFYEVLVLIKDTRAWMLFRGILVIVAFFLIAALLEMNTILWLGGHLLSAGVIALVVVFQPELRAALEQLGRNNLWSALTNLRNVRSESKRFDDRIAADIAKASFEMAAVKTGALIVIEREVRLTEYVRTGIALDSLISRQLLINIFEKNTPLHDGAVILRGDRVVAATCYLPLSDNAMLSKDLGTRHRAAVGISEVCDAMTIVVSEETGNVSVAEQGHLYRNVSMEQLEELLSHLQQITPENASFVKEAEPVMEPAPAAEPKAAETKVSKAKTSEAKTSEAKTPGAKTAETKTAEAKAAAD